MKVAGERARHDALAHAALAADEVQLSIKDVGEAVHGKTEVSRHGVDDEGDDSRVDEQLGVADVVEVVVVGALDGA